MRMILDTTDTSPGSVFMVRGGAPTYTGPQDILSRQQVLVDTHTGGTWTLQVESPEGIWVDTDITFDDVGVKAYWATQELKYRLNGGAPGARAWSTGVWSVS